jgi:hypothetical protein
MLVAYALEQRSPWWIFVFGLACMASSAYWTDGDRAMKHIPETHNALVLRTDFSDAAAWEAMCAAIQKPHGAFRAFVDFVDDSEYNSIAIDQVLALIPPASNHTFMFMVDGTALSQADHPILVVDLNEERGRTFRVIPSQMWDVENNLSLAILDFAEFADAVDTDGIFRGFSAS